MDPFLDFTGKTIVISGAASGFGAKLASELATRGAQLVLSDINTTNLEKHVAELSEHGASVIGVACDVTKPEQCQAVVDQALAAYGSLDIAINNAGASHALKKITHISTEEFDYMLNLNTKGVFYCMNAQIKHMKQQGAGVILNISSMAGVSGAPLMAAYSAAKHGVIGLTRTAALEYAKLGIRVNAACPYIITGTAIGETMGDTTQTFFEHCESINPMKRCGELDEAVAAMILMISPANTYMNGQAIAIDGGMSA